MQMRIGLATQILALCYVANKYLLVISGTSNRNYSRRGDFNLRGSNIAAAAEGSFRDKLPHYLIGRGNTPVLRLIAEC